MSASDLVVFENEYFSAEQATSCFVPGYLVVSAKAPATSVAKLERAAAESLGPTLARITEAIEDVLSPEVVYCARFGEETRQLHFHLFPRSARLAEEYRSAQRHSGPLNGPLVLSWARDRYALANSTEVERQEVERVALAIRARLARSD